MCRLSDGTCSCHPSAVPNHTSISSGQVRDPTAHPPPFALPIFPSGGKYQLSQCTAAFPASTPPFEPACITQAQAAAMHKYRGTAPYRSRIGALHRWDIRSVSRDPRPSTPRGPPRPTGVRVDILCERALPSVLVLPSDKPQHVSSLKSCQTD